MSVRFLFALCVLVPAMAGAADKLPKQAQKLLAMTPTDFANSAELKDDSLEVTATITTQPGFQEKRGLLKIVWNDNFLRAFVDKKTGAATYQLYQRIAYAGSGWKFYQLANYETPTGPKSVEVLKIGTNVDCSMSNIMGGCTYTETIAFPVDVDLLKTIAASYAPGVIGAWRFKFKSQSGEDYTDGMVPAEVAGLLQAVANYRTAKGLPPG